MEALWEAAKNSEETAREGAERLPNNDWAVVIEVRRLEFVCAWNCGANLEKPT
jgi:hypothetical protein